MWEISNLTIKEPSRFNGIVSFRRWKITVEPVEESRDVLVERLTKLYRECDNIHHRAPLHRAAAEIGWNLRTGTEAKPNMKLSHGQNGEPK